MHNYFLALFALCLIAFSVFFAHLNLQAAPARRQRGVGVAPVTRDETRTRRDAIRSALREALRSYRLDEFCEPSAGASKGWVRSGSGDLCQYRILREMQTDELYLVEVETSPKGEDEDGPAQAA